MERRARLFGIKNALRERTGVCTLPGLFPTAQDPFAPDQVSILGKRQEGAASILFQYRTAEEQEVGASRRVEWLQGEPRVEMVMLRCMVEGKA